MNLIFDFDGTICNSLDTTIEIANKILKDHNFRTITKSELKSKGALNLIKESNIPRYKIPFYTLMFVLKIRKGISKNIVKMKSYEGLPEVLSQLALKNKLGILTSNSKKNVERFLMANNMNKLFSFIEAEFSYFSKHKKLNRLLSKYKLIKKDTIYIGDETRDIIAAQEVGIKSATVTWGAESEKVLKLAHPNYIFDIPKNLMSLPEKFNS